MKLQFTFTKLMAMLLVLTMLLSVVGCAGSTTNTTETTEAKKNTGAGETNVSKAVYPTMTQYPNESDYLKADGSVDYEAYSATYEKWATDRRAQQTQSEGYADGLENYFKASVRQILSNADGENRICSPLNIYMALAMLAEVTDGNSRQQILDLLGAADIDALRTQAKAIWNANYSDDGTVTSILANSLWLKDSVSFNKDTLDTLASEYYASSYSGTMGSDEMNKALQDWLNEQTGGLLEEYASNASLPASTVLALASTIYYSAKWADEFDASQTDTQTFHAASGDVSTSFMHRTTSQRYYWGENFSAVSVSLEGSGEMWLILPNENTTLDALLQDDEVAQFLNNPDQWENSDYLTVNLSMPKFDVSSDIDLTVSLKAMGVTDVFDSTVSDFTPMTTDAENLEVSKVEHAARVKTDETGVEAAAYTLITVEATGAPPQEEKDFVLDRPFLFVISSTDNLPLFAGVVNQPTE